jgi:hypothetical protein
MDFSFLWKQCSINPSANSYLRCLLSISSWYRKWCIFIHNNGYFTYINKWIFLCLENTVQLIHLQIHVWDIHWALHPCTRGNPHSSITEATVLMLMNRFFHVLIILFNWSKCKFMFEMSVEHCNNSSIYIHNRGYFTYVTEWISLCFEHNVQLIHGQIHIWDIHWASHLHTKCDTCSSITRVTLLMLTNGFFNVLSTVHLILMHVFMGTLTRSLPFCYIFSYSAFVASNSSVCHNTIQGIHIFI